MRRRAVGVGLAVLLSMSPGAASAAGPGSPDPSFGTNGSVVTTFKPGMATSSVADVVVAADGRITVAGTAGDGAGRSAFALARYLPDGRSDETFGTNGRVVLQLGIEAEASHPAASYLRSLVLEGDGGVVAVGATNIGREGVVAAVRLDGGGRTLWVVRHQLGRPFESSEGFRTVTSSADEALLQSDGKLLLAGRATTEKQISGNPLLARLNTDDGSLDTTFAGTGSTIAEREPANEKCWGLHAFTTLFESPTGSIVAGGTAGCGLRGQMPQPILRAYTPSGVAIPDFAAGPLGLISFRELRAGPDTTILAQGAAPGSVYGQPAFARLSASGVLDPTFAAPDGVVSALGARPSGASSPKLAGFAVQRDGRLLSASNGVVVRMLPNGTPDGSFGNGGAAPTPIQHPADVALQPNGRILIVGQRDDGSYRPEPRFTITRLLDVAPGRVVIAPKASVRRRAARIVVTCAGSRDAADCRGIMQVTSAVRRRGERRVAFGGGASFALAPGARSTVRVPLNKTARRRLGSATHRRLTVRVTAAAVQRRVTLSATRSALR